MVTGIYRFEGTTAELEYLPLAARRALDLAGLKLALSAWQSLPLDRRRRLVALGVPDDVDRDAVRSLLVDARPSPLAIEPVDESTLDECPSEVRALLADRRPVDEIWSSLTRLGRFALRHLGRRGDLERLLVAFDELNVARGLSHLDARGEVHMVDVGSKAQTRRRAVARARIRMRPETARLVTEASGPKGDILATVRIAGIMGAKRTSDLIPLCHPIPLSHVAIKIDANVDDGVVTIDATAETHDRTGVEMEAMVAASVASLALYDMLKGTERGIAIEEVVLVEKIGGRSGHYVRGAP